MFSAQVYPPSAEHSGRLAQRLRLPATFGGVLTGVSMRLHPVIAYLDSSLSDPIQISRSSRGVAVSGTTSAQTRQRMRDRLVRLARTLRSAGHWLPVKTVEFTPPGTGYHFGGSLPHGVRTDTLGRPDGFTRIHVVDSSVLPTVGARSIAPTVMANAARIARLASGIEARR